MDKPLELFTAGIFLGFGYSVAVIIMSALYWGGRTVLHV